MSFADVGQDEELLATAARAVVAAFQDGHQREQLPGSCLVALRLLETALALYQHGKLEEEVWRTYLEQDYQAGPDADGG